MESSNYNNLIAKLDQFIRKYYVNRLIRGSLYAAGLLAGFYLLLILMEAAGRFGVVARTVLFFSFLGFLLLVLTRYVVIPLFKLFQIGDQISKEQAAEIIGKHFGNVSDKLLNTLELKRLADLNQEQGDLIMASIEQKSLELKPVPFSSAINLQENKKYLKYALPPLGVILVLLLASPSLITEPTKRILDFDQHYEVPNPFSFQLKNQDLRAIKNEDILLEVNVEGTEIPKEVFIEVNGLKYQLDKKSNTEFSYLAQNLQQSVDFRFYGSGYYSEAHRLEVFPKPVVKQSRLEITYPKYLNKEKEWVNGVSDVFIPEGSELTWEMQTQHTEQVLIQSRDTAFEAKILGENKYTYHARFLQDEQVRAILVENSLGKADSLNLQVHVVKDEFPKISVRKLDDSLSLQNFYFSGRADDDHGFSALNFVYSVNSGPEKKEKILFNPKHSILEFYHVWNKASEEFKAEDEVVYYFEVWDNDGVNGPKRSKSDAMYFQVPSARQIQEESDQKAEETQKDLEASLEEAKKMAREIDKLNQKMIEKKSLSWEEKKQLEELMQQQQELQKNFEQIKKENKRNNEKKNQFNPNSEDLLEKQKQLEELMERVLDEEMKKMLEDLQKLMEETNKEQIQQQLDELKLDNKDLEKELDRSLELFKQFEFEKQVEDTRKNLQDLQKKEEELAEKSLDKKQDADQLNEEQKKIEEEFKKIQEDLKDLEKKNNDLEQKNELPNLEQESKKAEENMQESKQQNSNNQRKKANQSQKNAAQQMKQMDQKLQKMQQQMAEQQQAEDLEKLRRLRQSLLELSFTQEDLIEGVKVTAPNDPKFVELTREQKKMEDDSKMIEDSLFAISKRNVQIQSMVNKEIASINDNMGKVVKNMADRKIPETLNRQQYVMTSLNNLALMLDESIQSAQKQQSAKKFGKKSCSKPGGGSPSMGQMKKAQKSLSQQLKDLQEQMKKQGGKKPGGQGGMGGRGSKMSEQAAKMAAQQNAIRNELRKMMDQMGEKPGGSTGGDQLQDIHNMMEQNEEDLVNMQITRETLRRQEKIMSRLLESERAERERELDNKRESQVGVDQPEENYILEEYLRQKEQQLELLESIPLELKPFYQNKVNGYYKKF